MDQQDNSDILKSSKKRRKVMRQPTTGVGFECEIRFKNHLDSCWHNLFEGLSIENLADGVVNISGLLPDEAAVFGLLNTVRDLNLKVVSFNVRSLNEK
jgi:hypothetical protein